MGNNGMASSIKCKASKVTVSGQGCGTTYIPSPRCSRRRIGREEEASTNRQKEKKKEKADQQPLANRRERYAERKEKNRETKKDGRLWLPSEKHPPPFEFIFRESRRSFEFRNVQLLYPVFKNHQQLSEILFSLSHITAKKLDNLAFSFSMPCNYLRIFLWQKSFKIILIVTMIVIIIFSLHYIIMYILRIYFFLFKIFSFYD